MRYVFEDYEIDMQLYELRQSGQPIKLEPQEFNVLAYLIEHRDQIVSKEELLEQVWPDQFVSESVLSQRIMTIRKALGESGRAPRYLKTIHGRGYRFVAAVESSSPLGNAIRSATHSAHSSSTSAAHSRPLPPRDMTGELPLQGVTRKLMAVLSADVQGYSRLMEADEAATVRTLTAYQELIAILIQQHNGRVIDMPGDNVLAGFNSAVDALQSAVMIQDELKKRNDDLPPTRQMVFRIGLNLGEVLIEGGHIYGDSVNIAARLESLAEGGGLCISGTVYDQVKNRLSLDYEDQGKKQVKNITDPVRVYKVRLDSAVEPCLAEGQLEPIAEPSSPALLPNLGAIVRPPHLFVAREGETDQLHRALTSTLQGQRQVLFVTGEAGIGKTTLINAFITQAAHTESVRVIHGQCIEQYGSGEAYLPILDALGRLCRAPEGQAFIARLRQQAPTWMGQMPWLLSDAEHRALQDQMVGATQERMLREMVELLDVLSAENPLVLVLEDLHWSDYSTVDLLARLAWRPESAHLLVLGTYRPEDLKTHDHPLQSVVQELQRRQQCEVISLAFFEGEAVQTYILQRCPGLEDIEDLADLIYQRTNGSPLFMNNVVEYWIAQDWLVEGEQRWRLRVALDELASGIPDTVEQLIERLFAQLSEEDQEILKAASVVGRTFATAAVAAGSGHPEEVVETRCEQLSRQGVFLKADGIEEWEEGIVTARYQFIHDLYPEYLYAQLTVSQKVRLHRQIGTRLETGYATKTGEIVAELAVHFQQGRQFRQAASYHQQAAEQALQRSAHREAIEHLTIGLSLLNQLLDDPERLQIELHLQATLGPALVATKGWLAPEAEYTFKRARELAQSVDDHAQLVSALYGLATLYELRGEFDQSQALMEQRLQQPGVELVLESHELLACSLFHQGSFSRALDHAEHGLTLYDPSQYSLLLAQYGENPGVSCHDWAALASWFLGYPEQALVRAHEALQLAQEHAYSLAHARAQLAFLHQCRLEVEQAQKWAEATIDVATSQGFPYRVATGQILLGWALSLQGQYQPGIELLQQGLAACQSMGAEMEGPYFLALLAEAQGYHGEYENGLQSLDAALTRREESRPFFYEAELFRLKGEFLLASGLPSQVDPAESCFQSGLDLARRQQAKSLELRTALSLGRLWQQQNKREEAFQLLAENYSGFTEGFDTDDLKEAKELLEELGG